MLWISSFLFNYLASLNKIEDAGDARSSLAVEVCRAAWKASFQAFPMTRTPPAATTPEVVRRTGKWLRAKALQERSLPRLFGFL
jgi:hypothetical protein